MNFVKQLWFQLPDGWRDQLRSAFVTFSCDFMLSLGTSFVATEDLSVTSGLMGATLLTALRAGVKAVMALRLK